MFLSKGFDAFKMKVGTDLEDDKRRLRFAKNVYIDGSYSVVRINCSLVIPVNRQMQSDGVSDIYSSSLYMHPCSNTNAAPKPHHARPKQPVTPNTNPTLPQMLALSTTILAATC